MTRWLPKKWWARILLASLTLILVPYVYSRVMSSTRCVQIFVDERIKLRPPQNKKIRIACYNIAHGRGLAKSNFSGDSTAVRLQRLDKIAELLAKIDADIVILNEADFGCFWSNSINHAKRIADKAGYRYRVEQRNMDFRVLFWTMKYGNAVLSKHPIDEATLIDFPAHSRLESWLMGKKCAVNCTIRFGDQKIRVLGVHASHRSEQTRVPSSERLIAVAKRSEIPVVIAGDMNASPSGFPDAHHHNVFNENSIEILDDTALFQRRPTSPPKSKDEMTFSVNDPKSVIDWIFVPSDWHIDGYRVEQSNLSDHRPVVLDATLVPVN